MFQKVMEKQIVRLMVLQVLDIKMEIIYHGNKAILGGEAFKLDLMEI